MAEERAQRRLAAIMAADVVGYSRLMGEDETGTLNALKELRAELINPTIAEHQGRIVKLMGDGALVEFASVVDAVECAISIQRDIVERTSDIPERKRITFRIGVNLGDVIIEGDDIYGDGVNVAARLEGLAEPGGVCISGSAFEQVRDKLAVGFEDLGEQQVKNIDRPVHTYRVIFGPMQPTTSTEPLPLPDKPSIAVLPFDNMSGDPEQEYFADGIAEDIITGLSRFHWFFVIARHSSFSYKGTSPDVRQVAKELGVQYVLEGSVRKGGNRVRITAQLVDALTGRHVWADSYDRDLEDIFAVQDEITQAIVGEVAPSFVSAEAKRVQRKTAENFNAWDNVIRGNWHLWRNSREDLAEARRQFESALDLEPKNAMALAGLAMAHSFVAILGWTDDFEESRATALSLAQLAVDSDDSNAWAYTALGFGNYFSNDLDNSIVACHRALELNPNLAIAEATLSIAHSWRGDDADALGHAEIAARLSPRDPQSRGYMALAVAEFGAGHYEQAVEWAKKTTEGSPNFPGGWRYLLASLAHLDRMEEARAAKDQLLRLSPNENLRRMRAAIPGAQPARMERWIEGFRKAGISE